MSSQNTQTKDSQNKKSEQNKKLLLLIMIILPFLTWYVVFNNKTTTLQEYDKYMKKAENFAKKEIYIDAVYNYQQALKLDTSNYDLMLKIFDSYVQLADDDGIEKTYEQAQALDPSRPDIYVRYINQLIDTNAYDDAVEVVTTAREKSSGKEIDELYEKIYRLYKETFLDYDYAYLYCKGYMKVTNGENGDRVGLIKTNGSGVLRAKYHDVGLYSEEKEVIPVCDENDTWYYVNSSGQKKLVPDHEYSYLGSFTADYAPALYNGKYGYVNEDFEEKNFEYDFAGSFEDGIAAVRKHDKWGIINDKLEMVTDFEFDDIIINDFGICSEGGYFFASKGGKYALYNSKGKQVGSESFENAKMFVCDEPAAVKQNGKWGFVDTDGKIVIKPQYEDANSFCLDFAPIQQGEFWGYIDGSGKIITDIENDKFSAAYSLDTNGYSVIYNDFDMPKLLRFYGADLKDK